MRSVYRNGVVHARGSVPPTAFVVEDGRIVWLGADDDAPTTADEIVDLAGCLVTPGFVDAHVSVLGTGAAALGVDLSGAASLVEALDLLAVAAARGDGVLVAYGWDEAQWPEGRPPRPEELVRAVGSLPVFALRADRCAAIVSAVLADDAQCRGLPGWDDGVATGDALERARAALLDVGSGTRRALVRAGLAVFARNGVVSVHEHSGPGLDTRAGLAELLAMTADPSSGLPEVVGYRAELCGDADDARRLAEEIPGLAGVGGGAVDGALGTRAAALRAPYADSTGDERGELLLDAGQVANHVGAVTRAGLQATFDVVGDRAMAEVLLGIQAAAEVEGVAAIRAAGHRLERAEMVDAPALARIVLLGLTVCAQPVGTGAGVGGLYERRLGPVRVADLDPLADLVGAGVPVAFGSGSPESVVDPRRSVRAAMRHPEPGQGLSAAAAFRAHTEGGRRAARRPEVALLRPGGPASFAVWVDEASPSAAGDSAGGAPDLLARLADPDARPTCVCTVRDGVVLYGETVPESAPDTPRDTP